MLIFWSFILVLKITVIGAVSRFKEIPEVEIDDVYVSKDLVRTTSVSTKAECALICESLGEFHCQSFNVRPEGGKIRCEIFDHLPINTTNMAEDHQAKLYERQCDPLYIVASMKEKLRDSQTLVTLIDDKGEVYQVKSSDPTPRHIGHFRTVFVGFSGRVDDLIQATIPPYGDVHFIREGLWVHCFLAVDEAHLRFIPCQPEDEFPILLQDFTGLPFSEGVSMVANHGVEVIFTVFPNHVTIDRFEPALNGSYRALKPDGPGVQYDCRTLRFCHHRHLVGQSSSGLVMSPTAIGLFYEAKFYVYDFFSHDIVLRYSVCRGGDASYMLIYH